MTERSKTASKRKYFIGAIDAMMSKCGKEDSRCQSYEMDRGDCVEDVMRLGEREGRGRRIEESRKGKREKMERESEE